jgi:hypothetical protein
MQLAVVSLRAAPESRLSMTGVVDDAISPGQQDPKPLVELLSEAFSRMLKG